MAAGGKSMARPNYGDATPPTPPRQGDMGPEGMGSNRVDENTFESGSYPTNTGAIESNWTGLIDSDGLDGKTLDFAAMAGGTGVVNKWPGEGIRGFRSGPVGGSFNPGNGTMPSNPGTEYSNSGYRG